MRLAALFLCLALIGCSGVPAPTTAQKAVQANLDDPWPECKQVREYFAENLGEPQSFEVVKWESRSPMKNNPGADVTFKEAPNTVSIRLKYRARNGQGAMEVRRSDACFEEGKIGAVYTTIIN